MDFLSYKKETRKNVLETTAPMNAALYASLIILLIKGLVVGFAIAAPVGPTALLCIRRTLKGHYFHGLATGLGAALADTVFGIIAGFGLASISGLLNQYDFYIRLFGSVLILWVGFNVFRSSPQGNGEDDDCGKDSMLSHTISSFFITVTNPITVLAFAAFFAAVGVDHVDDSILQPLALVVGVFGGALLWWFGLATIILLIRHKLNESTLVLINHSSGVLLILFGLYILGSVFWPDVFLLSH